MLRREIALAVWLVAAADCSPNAPDGSALPVRERWFKAQQGYGEARPAISGDTVVFTTGEPGLVARRVSDGQPYWSIPLNSIAVTRAVGGRNVLIRQGVAVVPILLNTVGIDLHTGQQLWSYEAPLDTINDPDPRPGSVDGQRIAADSTTIFIPAWGATVTAVDARTGAVRWLWRVDSLLQYRSGAIGATVSGDTVYVSAWHFLDPQGLSSEAWLLALDRVTGRELWRFTIPRTGSGIYVVGRPAVAGGRVILLTGGGYAWGVNPATGTLAWSFATGATHAIGSQVEPGGDTVFIDGGEGHIYALRAADGSLIWKSGNVDRVYNDMLITAGRVYVGSGGRMYVLGRTTGALVASFTDPRQRASGNTLFASSAAAASGGVFVTMEGGDWAFDEP